jgi:hypothetical protein
MSEWLDKVREQTPKEIYALETQRAEIVLRYQSELSDVDDELKQLRRLQRSLNQNGHKVKKAKRKGGTRVGPDAMKAFVEAILVNPNPKFSVTELRRANSHLPKSDSSCYAAFNKLKDLGAIGKAGVERTNGNKTRTVWRILDRHKLETIAHG